jgi:hypothetical protein
MGQLVLSKTLNHRTWASTPYANDRTIHATLQRYYLVAADRKDAEVGESAGVS